MDIKKVLTSVMPVSVREREDAAPADKAIKADSATDRDANGQMPGKEDQGSQEPPTEAEFQEALEFLRKQEFVVKHGWTVRAETMNEKRFVLILDQLGKVIRRIPEIELKSLLAAQRGQKDQKEQKGQLIRRTA